MADILCSVESCVHNNRDKHKCTLNRIQVIPNPNSANGTVEESNCGSFKKKSQN
ncbi:MAG TPA: DUF1540 domain-containing protein [Clostridia bacterium]|nr:DUF1540 domain-containing protein [Clostridia bacterium]